MSHSILHITKFLALLGVVCFAANLRSAEIEIRSNARCDSRVIRLGDLCDIHATNEQLHQQLAAIELAPAPQQGSTLTVRARDIQDRLSTLGVNLAEHRFTGANSVTVNNGNGSVKQARPLLTPTQIKSVETAVARVAQNQISNDQNASTRRDPRTAGTRKAGESPFVVIPMLSDEQIETLHTRLSQLQLVSQIDLKKSEQSIVLQTGRDMPNITVTIQLQDAPKVVVATRSVPRGVILTSYDVELQPATANARTAGFTTLDEVVGREAAVAIAPGQVLDTQYVRAPLVVIRGEVVDVVVRSGGVRVHTKARARSDGGVGDVVQVSLLHTKESLISRVSGPHTVEVLGSVDAR